jgi:hypothetical protein
MRKVSVFIDDNGMYWPTEAEARAQDERRYAGKILEEFAALENRMRERLQNQEAMIGLADVLLAVKAIYERNAPAAKSEGGNNVGHDGTVDRGDAAGDAGSDPAGGDVSETGGTTEDQEAKESDHLDGT